MSVDAEAFRQHAALVAADRLARASRHLRTLGPEERDAVSVVARTVAEGTVRCLLEEAERNASLAEALRVIYGDGFDQRHRGVSTPAGAHP